MSDNPSLEEQLAAARKFIADNTPENEQLTLSEDEKQVAYYSGMSEDEYLKRKQEIAAQRSRSPIGSVAGNQTINQSTQSDERDPNQLSEAEKAAAQGFRMSEEEYLKRRNEIRARKGE